MPLTAEQDVKRSASAAATINALLPDGRHVVRQLFEGDSVVVGSLEGCDVQLEGEDVAGTHCILGVDDGTVWLRDCYSPTGTFVDDRRVSEARLEQSASIRVGSCELSLHLHGAPTEPGDSSDLSLDRPSWQSDLEEALAPAELAEAAPQSSRTAPLADEQDVNGEVGELRELLQQAHDEIQGLRDQLERYQHQEAFSVSSMLATEGDPFQEEMVELLRTEVVELQNELAQRDARLSELQGTERPPSADDDASISQKELETLVTRLEQLLEELQRKEEHVGLLEEMLRASEEANRAEQEERRQLEEWVKDIEHRVGERESEWQAGAEKLQKTIDEQAEQRRRLEQSLQEALSGSHAVAIHEELTEELRQQVAQLQSQLQAAEQQRNELQRQLKSPRQEPDPATREQQAQIARERADLARQRAQLESLRQEPVPQQPRVMPAPAQPQLHTDVPQAVAPVHRSSDADERIRALRQHLQQTSDDEPAQTEKPATLSSRIASLWRKLESSD